MVSVAKLDWLSDILVCPGDVIRLGKCAPHPKSHYDPNNYSQNYDPEENICPGAKELHSYTLIPVCYFFKGCYQKNCPTGKAGGRVLYTSSESVSIINKMVNTGGDIY